MNEVEVFNFEANDVRTVVIENEAWFVGKDVAQALGYSNSRKALLDHVDDEDKGVTKSDTLGGNQNVTIINESGLYSLILKSKKPEAKKFKRWVTSEVLPAIRKHGAYMTDKTIEDVLTNPDTVIRLATELKKERQAKAELEQNNLVLAQQINEFKPKIDFVDVILKNKSLVSVSVISKDYGMTARKMNKLLYDLHIQFKQGKMWLLYREHQTKGWTQSETYENKLTHELVVSTKWTQKGRLGIYELLKSHNILPIIERED